MSDDSPQKGWDTWFGAEEDSPGGGQQVPEQQVPPTQPASEPESESESEQTNWTVPSLGAVLEGQPPRPDAAATQQVTQQPQGPQAQTQQAPQSSEPRQQVAQTAEAMPTQRTAPDADAAQGRQAPDEGPAAAPASPASGSAQGQSQQQAQVGPPVQEAWQPQVQDQSAQQQGQQQAAHGRHQGQASAEQTQQAQTQWQAPQDRAQAEQPEEAQQAQWQPPQAQDRRPEQPQTQWQPPQDQAQQAEQTQQAQWQAPAQAEQAQGQWQAEQTEQAQGQWQAQAEAEQAQTQWQPPQDQQQPSHEQPTQVWSAAPADAAPTTQLPPQAQQQPQQPSHEYAQPTQALPQLPQNPYAAAASQQQAQPQAAPAGYGQAPPQAPAHEGQAGWDEPNRPRPAAFAAAAGDEPRPRVRRKVLLSSGIGAVVIVGLATALVMNQGSLTGSSHALASASPTPSGFQPTGTSVTGDASQTAAAFLSAWQSGDFKQAAAYTDDPTAALSTLTSYETGLNLNGLQLTATGASALTSGSASASSTSTAASGSSSAAASTGSSASAAASAPSSTAGVVTFNVVAKVGLPSSSTSSTSSASASASASSAASSSASSSSTSTAVASSVTANWSYSSKLTAYKKNGGWWIQWAPSLVAPNLTASEKIVSAAISPSASKVEDANGNDLSSATDPGVHNIYLALKSSAPSGEGTPGVEIELENASGTPISSSTDVLSQPVDTGVVKTTINPTAESAAQSAVTAYPDSSMVVLQPSTGDILAVANNDGENDFALTARIAPGSTNKIITSTALLTSGLVSSPSQAVQCPASITVDGTVFKNSENESEPANTPFLDDFAISCNNAFGRWYSTIGSTTLADTAEKYYGLNEQWDLGTGEAGPYYTIPSSASNGELFQELFGQGQLEAAPLAMASVAATVDNGSFKQPIVVPGTKQVTATALPSAVQQDLWQMMKAVVYNSSGTAYNVFSGVNSTVYGKTGTADVGSTQDKPNSWMVVFDPTLDIAVGCVVLDAGYGASYAGPETATLLKALQ